PAAILTRSSSGDVRHGGRSGGASGALRTSSGACATCSRAEVLSAVIVVVSGDPPPPNAVLASGPLVAGSSRGGSYISRIECIVAWTLTIRRCRYTCSCKPPGQCYTTNT